MEFKAGDKVKCVFFGDEVFTLQNINADKYYEDYIFKIEYKDITHSFTIDGKYYSQHTHPVLTLVERPTKKIAKRFWRWIFFLHHAKSEPDYFDDNGFKTCGDRRENWDTIKKIKLENCFIDIEVDAETFKE